MGALKSANLALCFVLELCALVALGCWLATFLSHWDTEIAPLWLKKLGR